MKSDNDLKEEISLDDILCETPIVQKCFTEEFAKMIQLLRIMTDNMDFSQPFKMIIEYNPEQPRMTSKMYKTKESLQQYIEKIQEQLKKKEEHLEMRDWRGITMIGEIKDTYRVSKTYEISVNCGGNNYLIIYGKHINGWFIAIPNWNICTEAGHPSNVFYNTEKLAHAMEHKDIPNVLAKTIKKHYEIQEDSPEIVLGNGACYTLK